MLCPKCGSEMEPATFEKSVARIGFAQPEGEATVVPLQEMPGWMCSGCNYSIFSSSPIGEA